MIVLWNLHAIPQYTIFCTMRKDKKKLMHFIMTFFIYVGSRNVGRSDVQDRQRVRIFYTQ